MSLLLIFNSPITSDIPEPEISLPDLHIKDALTREPVPVTGLPGYNGEFIQSLAIQTAPLSFQDLGNFAIPDKTQKIATLRYSTLVVYFKFESPGENITFRVLLEDVNGVQAITPASIVDP